MNHWSPGEFLSLVHTQNYNSQASYAVLLLNQPILDEKLFENLWNSAALRISVDGGGNQWHSVHSKASNNLKLPDVASGDFDSLGKDVLEFFKQSKVEIIETPDQDATDFTKALLILSEKLANDVRIPKMDQVIAFCEPSGRFDQIMANVETMFLSASLFTHQQLYLMGSTSITCLLHPGQHTIKVSDLLKNHSNQKMYCSLIPIGCESTVTTTGLKWNLNNDVLAFGRLVSTSNEVANDQVDVVTVLCSHPVVWSLNF